MTACGREMAGKARRDLLPRVEGSVPQDVRRKALSLHCGRAAAALASAGTSIMQSPQEHGEMSLPPGRGCVLTAGNPLRTPDSSVLACLSCAAMIPGQSDV